MRLDRANRSFFALVALALVPYLLLGVFGCGLLSVVVYRLGTQGIDGLQSGNQDLRPAVVFFAVVVTGTLIAGWSVYRQARATRRLRALIAGRTKPEAPGVIAAARRARLDGRIDVVHDTGRYSFTYGFFSPRVTVSDGLVEATSVTELEAVLQHESYHVRNHDTLKAVVARAAPSAFFFLPALRNLRDRYLAGRELAADRRAVGAVGRAPLAGALHSAVSGPTWTELESAAALGGSEFLHQRVEQLEDGREPTLPRIPRLRVWLTAGGLAVVLAVFGLTIALADAPRMSMSGTPSDDGGAVLMVLGVIVCICAWVVGGLFLWWRVQLRHRHVSSTPSP